MKKKAVIVGINDYAPIGNGGPDLNGCVNDARDMANTLVICGFSPANIKILTNQNATRANILKYLDWLLATTSKADSIVFYYSGHGTRLATLTPELEFDGLDEAIVPHDYAESGFLRDKDFKELFNKKLKKGVNLEVIFDCCFSGTGTRNLSLAMGGKLPSFVSEKARFIEPMLEDEFYYNFAKEMINVEGDNIGVVVQNKALVPIQGMNHTLWAACKDNQVAMEGVIGDQNRGYFTYHLCKILRATNGNIIRKTLDGQIANALAAMGAAQINQTECKPIEFNQKIFS